MRTVALDRVLHSQKSLIQGDPCGEAVVPVTATLTHKANYAWLLGGPTVPASDFNCSRLLVSTFSHCKVNYKTVNQLFWQRTFQWLPIFVGFFGSLVIRVTILVSDSMFSLVELVLKILSLQ